MFAARANQNSAPARNPNTSPARPRFETKAEWAEWMLSKVVADRKLLEDMAARACASGRWRDDRKCTSRVSELHAEELKWKSRINAYKAKGI